MGGRYNIHKDWTRMAYLSVVMDLYNREIIGFSRSKSVDTELIKRALGNALQNIMLHSDSSKSYNKIAGSGCPYDNSYVEGFFSILKREYSTMKEIERNMFEYIELFYNNKRIHSTLGYQSPVQYRMKYNDNKEA